MFGIVLFAFACFIVFPAVITLACIVLDSIEDWHSKRKEARNGENVD